MITDVKVDLLNMKNACRNTVLDVALKYGAFPIVSLLKKSGAQPSRIYPVDRLGVSHCVENSCFAKGYERNWSDQLITDFNGELILNYLN